MLNGMYTMLSGMYAMLSAMYTMLKPITRSPVRVSVQRRRFGMEVSFAY